MAPFNYAVTPPPASPGLSPVSTSPDPCSPVHPLHFLVPSPVELSRVGSGGKEGGPCGLSPGPWGRRGGGGSGGAQPLWPRFTCLGRSPRPALGGRGGVGAGPPRSRCLGDALPFFLELPQRALRQLLTAEGAFAGLGPALCAGGCCPHQEARTHPLAPSPRPQAWRN